MKAKYVLGIFLILMMATTACAYAAEATIDDYKFTVPKDFEVIDSGDVVHMNKTDDTQALTVMISENDITGSDSVNNMIKGLEDQGYSATSDTFKYKGTEITQIDYKNLVGRGHMYIWKEDDIYVGIVYAHITAMGTGEWAKCPAREVFDTFEKK